jgi:hypothetical protein
MTGKNVLAANTNSGNVLAQLPFEFISGANSIVGVNLIVDVDLCNFTFQSGGETLAQNTTIFKDAAAFIPTNIFHQYLRFMAAPGERLFMDLLNGANAAEVYWAVRVDPVAG